MVLSYSLCSLSNPLKRHFLFRLTCPFVRPFRKSGPTSRLWILPSNPSVFVEFIVLGV